MGSMKKIFFTFLFVLLTNFLFAQMPEACNKCLQKLVQSSSHYKNRFGNKDILLNKKWTADASSGGHNLTFTIYSENDKFGAYNRIVTYQLHGVTNKLSDNDTYSKYNSGDVNYNKKLLKDVYKYCRKNNLFIKDV